MEEELDAALAGGRFRHPFEAEALLWIHRRLCEEGPPEMLLLPGPGCSTIAMLPGRFRGAGDPEVVVGRHIPPSGGRVPAFVDHLARRLGPVLRTPEAAVLALPAAHHRLAFIHPFPDLNGRVSRLAAGAWGRQAGLAGPWSLACALREGLRGPEDYLRMMDFADRPRQGDRDGCGNLSLQALEGFTGWMLRAMGAEIARASATAEPELPPTL